MSKQKKSGVSGRLSGSIFVRFMGTVLIYLLVLFACYIGAMIFSASIPWQGDELLYRILRYLGSISGLLLVVMGVGGVLVIFFYYWRRTLGYIDAMVQAGDLLASDSEELISLPAELVQVENQFNRSKQASLRNAQLAREAEQRKNDLIVYLAHDLKAPLTSVIGYLTLLRDEPEISPQLQAKYLGIALNKAERLEELINEFFDITRFSLSHLTLELRRVNLTRMLEQITSEFQPIFDTKGLTYALDLPPDMEILCDADKLERVFDNLLRNAVNYSYPDTEIQVQAILDGDLVVLKFINQGATIPKEKLGHLFEQFYRLDSARGTASGGAGLGLAIAKEIVTLHGGSITADSRDEQVIFTLLLPREGPPEQG